MSAFKFSVDSLRTIRVSAKEGRSGQDMQLQYSHQKVIGNGSFGVVYQVKINNNGEDAAIKKVLQDKRFENRELEIMRLLDHPNICAIKAYFYSQQGENKDEIYLNLVMEYVPETVYKVVRHYIKLRQSVPMLVIKLYIYQLFRSLAYSHTLGICHRDIKPQNLLVHPISGVLKLCDFGSAKVLQNGGANVAYICSRHYRAPELVFGAKHYSFGIDIWSAGCVMGEMLLGRPLFAGDNGVNQLIEIIKVLGTPSREQLLTMNPDYIDQQLPSIQPYPFAKVFRATKAPPEAIDLLTNILQYDPSKRPSASEVLVHPFFDELRSPNTRMTEDRDLPALFDFTREELSIRPDLIHKLVPSHCIDSVQRQCGIDINNFVPIPLEDLRLYAK